MIPVKQVRNFQRFEQECFHIVIYGQTVDFLTSKCYMPRRGCPHRESAPLWGMAKVFLEVLPKIRCEVESK